MEDVCIEGAERSGEKVVWFFKLEEHLVSLDAIVWWIGANEVSLW